MRERRREKARESVRKRNRWREIARQRERQQIKLACIRVANPQRSPPFESGNDIFEHTGEAMSTRDTMVSSNVKSEVVR